MEWKRTEKYFRKELGERMSLALRLWSIVSSGKSKNRNVHHSVTTQGATGSQV
jgi:hypothetical protein